MLSILNIACGLLVFIVMKTRSLRRIFPNPLTHARLLVGVFDLPVDGVYAMFFQEIIRLAERSAAKESTVRR